MEGAGRSHSSEVKGTLGQTARPPSGEAAVGTVPWRCCSTSGFLLQVDGRWAPGRSKNRAPPARSAALVGWTRARFQRTRGAGNLKCSLIGGPPSIYLI